MNLSRFMLLTLIPAAIKVGEKHDTVGIIAVCVFAFVVFAIDVFFEALEAEDKRKARERELERIRTGRY